MFCLYKLYSSENKLLYVGITKSITNRLAQHNNRTWYKEIARIDTKLFLTRKECLEAEKETIKTENPIFNKYQNNSIRNRSNWKQCGVSFTHEHIFKLKTLSLKLDISMSHIVNKILTEYFELNNTLSENTVEFTHER